MNISSKYKRSKRAEIVSFLIIVIASTLIPVFFSVFIINEATTVLIAVGASLCLQILTGLAGQLSLGSAALLASGAFTSGILYYALPGTPFLLIIFFSGLFGALVGLVVGLTALRVRGLYLIIATLALQYIVIFYAQQIQQNGPGVVGYLLQRPKIIASDTKWYYFILGFALLCTFITVGYKHSPVGRAWLMTSHNEIVAEGIGLNTRGLKLQAFVLTSFVTAILGALLGYTIGVVTYESFGLNLSILYISIIIISGIGSTSATWLGAVFVVWLPLWISRILEKFGSAQNASLNAQVGVLFFGVSIILIMLFLPGGIASVFKYLNNQVTRLLRPAIQDSTKVMKAELHE
jgi:branched-chain amino acid transport system permease protein